MSAARALLALACAGGLLAGCSSAAGPAGERREAVATLTEAANAGDAGGVRRHADRLVELVQQQLAGDQVDPAEAERLTALARSVRAGADAIDVDLQRRLEAEAEAEAARTELEEAQRRLEEERRTAEEERRKAEEAARQAEEAERQAEEDKGKGKDDEGEKKKDEDEDD